MKKKLKKFLSIDGLYVLAIWLLIMIPLWPKIPLFSPIEQYIVRVRAEDFFVLLASLWWGGLFLKQKVRWRSPMTLGILSYIAVGILSTISAVLITKTVPLKPLHLAKTLLHLFRYIEYFSLFFIFYAVITTLKKARLAISVLAIVVIAVSIYGYGQKYFYWPVYSTMNREFSKGIRLYLTEHARVQSTFAGHYDLAAFLVIILPLLLAISHQIKNKARRYLFYTAFTMGSWLLVVSASRTPFAAYIVGVTIVLFWQGWLEKKWKKRIQNWLKRSFLAYTLIFVITYYFGTELLDRLSFAISNDQTGIQIDIKKSIDHLVSYTPLPTTQELALLLKNSEPPPQAISTTEAAKNLSANQVATNNQSEKTAEHNEEKPVVASASDEPPSPIKPAARPKDVFVDVPEEVEETVKLPNGGVTRRTIHRARVYSDCALERELSLCIRLESLWPWALDGFYTNPILGVGYATLNKQFIDEFTIAESTDNNYLRTLGETGALGFITFYGTIILALVLMLKNRQTNNQFRRNFYIGLSAGIISLLINAVYIDVFAASKVAFTFWAMIGMATALIQMEKAKV